MSKRTDLVVSRMAEGDGYVVARTDDEERARQAVREHVVEEVEGDGCEAAEIEEEVARRLAGLSVRVGWYRWNPCHKSSCFDGGGHSGHLAYVEGPGRGVFRGVYLQS